VISEVPFGFVLWGLFFPHPRKNKSIMRGKREHFMVSHTQHKLCLITRTEIQFAQLTNQSYNYH